jgi:NlpC/P60 family putative phage cell wall peptidase
MVRATSIDKTTLSRVARSEKKPALSNSHGGRVIALARGWIGTPYAHQASLKGVGCDCLGLLRGVWRELVGAEPESVPAYAADWAEAGGTEQFAAAARRHLTEISLHDAEPGDVLLFRWRPHLPAKHAAILAEHGRMIHAHEGASVREVFFAPFWRRRAAFAFRFPPPSSAFAPAKSRRVQRSLTARAASGRLPFDSVWPAGRLR